MIFKYLLIAFLTFSISVQMQSQQINQAEIRKQLDEDGIDEIEVQRRLIAQGFDPTKIDLDNPVQVAELQTATEKIIEQIKAEKKTSLGISTSAVVDTMPSETVSQVQINQSEILDAAINDVAPVELEALPPPTIYGQSLYRDGGIKFYKKSEYIQPSASYILGPGDNISVAIWGRSEVNFNQEISTDGYVKFYQMPRIYLSGLTLEDAKGVLKSRFENNYNFNPNNFEVKVSASRNINIFIGGDVLNIGSYNISSLNTAINALAAAGGPTDIGSLRKIQLIRADGTKQTLDLYKFLKDPSVSDNYYLQDNDYIIVPVATKIVTIVGAINRRFKYELLEGEDLKDLIAYAGGLQVNALKQNIKITRYENDEIVILNVDLNKNDGDRIELKNGDVVEVLSISERVKNAVYVEGALENPGAFALSSGMKISDLLDKTVLTDDARLDIAYLVRLNNDKRTVRYEIVNIQSILNNGSNDEELLPGDKLIIRGKSDFVSKRSFAIGGAVRSGGSYDLDGDTELKLSDAIYLSGGLTDNATNFAYIIRKPPGQLNPNYISLNLDEALTNPQSTENINLMPGDLINVYDQSVYFDESFVSIQGEVRNPQTFTYDATLSLRDVLLQAGGLTLQSAKNKIDIFRIEFLNNNKTRTLVANVSVDEDLNITSGGDFELKPFDQIVVRRAPEFELQRAVSVVGEAKYPGTFYLIDDNSTILDIINDAGGFTDEAFKGGITLFRSKDDVGFIVVDIEKATKNPNSTLNVILQEGDRIRIPKKNNLVSVQGAVNKTEVFTNEVASAGRTNFVFEKGKSVKDYIESAGGFLENADKSSVTVSYPNGEKQKVKRFLFFKNYPEVLPGSVISVDYERSEEERTESSSDEDIDWGSILSNSIAQATAILSLILLIQNVD